jgi:hypothetical protein
MATLCQNSLYPPVRNFGFGLREVPYPLYVIIYIIHVVFTYSQVFLPPHRMNKYSKGCVYY